MFRRLIIPIILICCLCAVAQAEGSALLPLPEDEWVSGLFTDGETLYVITDQGLRTWRAGDAETRIWSDKIDLPGPEDGEDGLGGWRYEFDGLSFFVNEGRLCGARLLTDADGAIEALQLCDVALTESGTVEARNARSLAAPAAIRDSGLSGISALCARDGVLYLMGYGDDGTVLCAADSAEAKSARVTALGWNGFHLLPAPDGPILVEEGYDEGTKLYRVGRDGGMEKLCDLPPFTGGVAVDPVTGAIFAALDGRIRPVDRETGALGAPVSALPLRLDGAVALRGRYCAWMQNNVAALDTETTLDESGVLSYSTSFSAPWLDEALLTFAVAHPELALAQAEVPMEDVLDRMLTRSPEADVYITDIRDGAAAYLALLKRGYMLPLERETLRAFNERLYPGIRRDTTGGDAPFALPVHLNGWGPGVNESVLARLGLSISDVPDDWDGFLTFLEAEILPRLDDLGPGASFTYTDLSAEGFRFHLRIIILSAWVNCASAAGVAPDYGDPRLAALLERVDGMDFTAYGLTEVDGGDEGWGYGYSYGSGDRVLIQFSTPYALDDDGADGTPLLLGFGDDLPGTLPLNMTAAFVNPYTAHPEAALDLMEALLEHLPTETRYALCPDLTEPPLDPDYEAGLASRDEDIEALRAELDAAQPQDRQALEEVLAEYERRRDDYAATGKWLIPPEKLAWYRAHGDRVCVTAPSWFERDTTGEAWQLQHQYIDGLISAREFLAAVEQKARMMALEEG